MILFVGTRRSIMTLLLKYYAINFDVHKDTEVWLVLFLGCSILNHLKAQCPYLYATRRENGGRTWARNSHHGKSSRKDCGMKSPEEKGLCRFYATKLSENPECQDNHGY